MRALGCARAQPDNAAPRPAAVLDARRHPRPRQELQHRPARRLTPLYDVISTWPLVGPKANQLHEKSSSSPGDPARRGAGCWRAPEGISNTCFRRHREGIAALGEATLAAPYRSRARPAALASELDSSPARLLPLGALQSALHQVTRNHEISGLVRRLARDDSLDVLQSGRHVIEHATTVSASTQASPAAPHRCALAPSRSRKMVPPPPALAALAFQDAGSPTEFASSAPVAPSTRV